LGETRGAQEDIAAAPTLGVSCSRTAAALGDTAGVAVGIAVVVVATNLGPQSTLEAGKAPYWAPGMAPGSANEEPVPAELGLGSLVWELGSVSCCISSEMRSCDCHNPRTPSRHWQVARGRSVRCMAVAPQKVGIHNRVREKADIRILVLAEAGIAGAGPRHQQEA